MITLNKLREFEEYHGYYDGFYMQKVKKGTNVNSDNDWSLIDNLRGAVMLVIKNLASKEYTEILNKKLQENCDSEKTIEYLKKLAKEEWE